MSDDELDEDYGRPIPGRGAIPFVRASSLGASFRGAATAHAWPRSYQRSTAYMAGTPLLISPWKAFQHDTGHLARGTVSAHSHGGGHSHTGAFMGGRSTPRPRKPARLQKKSLTVGAEPVGRGGHHWREKRQKWEQDLDDATSDGISTMGDTATEGEIEEEKVELVRDHPRRCLRVGRNGKRVVAVLILVLVN